MTTHFITAEIDLSESTAELQDAIAQTLDSKGDPLRWAITHVETETQTATVEAVVTPASPPAQTTLNPSAS